ncbi:hypothetical protein G6F68_013757 [Rhizopus microsporus]|nr:hypothetical protein G6F68_013757 [Rhizopus microsporus]
MTVFPVPEARKPSASSRRFDGARGSRAGARGPKKRAPCGARSIARRGAIVGSEAGAHAGRVLGDVTVAGDLAHQAPGPGEVDLATQGAQPGALEVVAAVHVAGLDPGFGHGRGLAAQAHGDAAQVGVVLEALGVAVVAIGQLNVLAHPGGVGGEVDAVGPRHVVADAQLRLVQFQLQRTVVVVAPSTLGSSSALSSTLTCVQPPST